MYIYIYIYIYIYTHILKFRKNNIFLYYNNDVIGPMIHELDGYFRKYRELILKKQIPVIMGLSINT